MGWFLRGLGDFGNSVGEGQNIAQDYRARQQKIAFDAATQKQNALMAPLLLQELQGRIKAMQGQQQQADPNVQIANVEKLLGRQMTPDERAQFAGFKSAAPPPKITTPFESWRSTNPNSPLEDWFKMSAKPIKQEESKPTTEIFGGYRWQFDPEKKVQGQRDPTGQYVRLGPAKEPGNAGSGEKTPFELWKAQNPKGTYQQWADTSKQVDRSDATKAVSSAMGAFKNLQSQQNNSQRIAGAWSMWKPGTWGSGDVSKSTVQSAQQDFDAKKLDAIQKLTDAGMPIPAWLTGGPQSQGIAPPTAPPPPGFVLNKGN